MKFDRRRFLRLAASAAALSAAPRVASAQSYPDRPVRVVVPYAPGGPTDVVTRLLAQKISDRTGKQFFVENIGGGGAAGGRGQAARPCGDQRGAFAVAAGRADHGGGRLPRRRRRQLAGHSRSSRDAEGDHRLPASRDRRGREAAGYPGATRRARL